MLRILDQGSTMTLGSQKLIDQQQIRGEDAHYIISTINHTMERRKGKRVSFGSIVFKRRSVSSTS